MAAHTALDVVVRFSTANPDIVLSIASPQSTSTLGLKQQIRASLDSPASESRLRLIHAGKVLGDTVALSTSLNIAPPPSVFAHDDHASAHIQASRSAKQKGKQPLRDEDVPSDERAAVSTPPVPARARVYVHCSIGDVLSAADLAAESTAALEADAALTAKSSSSSAATSGGSDGPTPATTTTPAPRGFDRLLSAGFTAAEVAALRTQFLAIQAHTHTPDTMPSGPELLALEERWLDNGSGAAGGATGGAAGGIDGDGEDTGALEDALYGNIIGFFWPIAAVCWLMREEGVWSRRRQIAVLSGILVNLTFGWLRITS